MAAADFDQWSTARPYIGGTLPVWAGAENGVRLASYLLYEQMYWNVPEAFKLIQRGADAKPIYIPAGKQIIETMHRYLAPGLRMIPDPELGSDTEKAELQMAWTLFSRRERFASKFSANKRYGLIRGDWLWHIVGDLDREEGSRVSMLPLDPGSYFPIWDPDDIDTIIGCHIVDTIVEGDKEAIYRLTYRKTTETGGPSPISVEEAVYEIDKWGGPDMDEKSLRIIRAPELLPEPIDSLPVYHMSNFSEPGSLWGSSELRGVERLLSAINQSISDEELELVLNGLGVYVTDAGTPVDKEGNPTTWNLGPAKVVELPNGKTFGRVSGTTTVEPHQSHLKYLHEQLDLSAAIPAVAKGRVDVQVAESGIALLLEMAPLFARAQEKEENITDVMTNIGFDIKKWWSAYGDASTSDNVALIPAIGDRIPPNRERTFKEIIELYTASIVSMAWVAGELKKIGYDLGDADAMMNAVLEEKAALAQIQSDVEGSRIDSELEDEDGEA